MWRPYFASAAWDPYANGAWAWYQGAGYSWVSPYPWGWMPYHYGSWAFCPGMGWGWMPGGYWNGLNNIAMIPQTGGSSGGGSPVNGNPHFRPLPPPHPPRVNEPTMMAVNSKPLVRSEIVSGERFTFRNDSAGLGVPRDGFGRLNKVAEHVQQHGSVNQQIYFSAPPQAMQGARPTSTGVMAGSIHRGAAPPPASMGGGSFGGRNPGGYSGPRSAGSGPVLAPAPAPAPAPVPMSTGRPSH